MKTTTWYLCSPSRLVNGRWMPGGIYILQRPSWPSQQEMLAKIGPAEQAGKKGTAP